MGHMWPSSHSLPMPGLFLTSSATIHQSNNINSKSIAILSEEWGNFSVTNYQYSECSKSQWKKKTQSQQKCRFAPGKYPPLTSTISRDAQSACLWRSNVNHGSRRQEGCVLLVLCRRTKTTRLTEALLSFTVNILCLAVLTKIKQRGGKFSASQLSDVSDIFWVSVKLPSLRLDAVWRWNQPHWQASHWLGLFATLPWNSW